jgi:glycosyltransferase involved in cell wall biosynthesis
LTINIDDELNQAKELAQVLYRMYRPRTVVDIGCNRGWYLEGLEAAGCIVLGIDNDPDSLSLAKVPVANRDITKPLALKPHDLVICLEVVEHIAAELEDAVIWNLCHAGDTIVFSAAVPGQGGDGHINCQPKQYWIDKFKKRGFELDEKETKYIVMDMRSKPGTMGWLLNNVCVFRRKGVPTTFKEPPMRFHVVNLPHTQTTKEYLPCAYTQKVVNFCRMMKSLGHEVFLYASEINDAPCDELITCITIEQQRAMLPPSAGNWKKDFFAIDWNSNLPYWQAMNMMAIEKMKTRLQPRDFICLIGGNCQKPIADAYPGHQTVEFGIGYSGVFSKHRVFESYAWMHYVNGELKNGNGNSYDTVIPNYFDPSDFPFCEKPDDYFLYIGRLISRKGVIVAHEVCKRIGAKLIMAGQGVTSSGENRIVAPEITLEGGDIHHVGTVDVKQRGELMSKARAVFVPTQYIGPFEGVHVEAMMCGTPVITTDWGVFTETVQDGLQGYRTRTLGEAMWAARAVDKLDRRAIRDYAIGRWSLDVVRYRYQDYFRQLLGLWGDGWYNEEYDPSDKRVMGNFI